MSKSGTNSAIECAFIDRVNKKYYSEQPKYISSITYSTDIRQMSSSFDFEIQYGRDKVPDIKSHDFVEFFTTINGQKHQIGVGIIEDFVKKISSKGAVFQGNGRDFLSQLFYLPFKVNLNKEGNSFLHIINEAIDGCYLLDYLKFKNFDQSVKDYGLFHGPMLFKSTITQMKAAVLQEYADLAQNIIYQDRLGSLCVYGRSYRNSFRTNQTLNCESDFNVVDVVEKQNYSKVLSESLLIWAGEENLNKQQIKAGRLPSSWKQNTDERAKYLNQPFYHVYSAQDLMVFEGAKTDTKRIEELASAFLRKSNQNLSQIVITVDAPYFQGDGNFKLHYEIGQIWNIKSTNLKINREYKLAAIHYQQQAESLSIQLGFVEPDTLV